MPSSAMVLRKLLEGADDMQIIGEASNGVECVKMLVEAQAGHSAAGFAHAGKGRPGRAGRGEFRFDADARDRAHRGRRRPRRGARDAAGRARRGAEAVRQRLCW